MWRQIQTDDIGPTGYRREAAQVFLGVVGDEVIIKGIYSNGYCLTTLSSVMIQ